LDGSPTSYATVARRKGNDWWVAGISVNERTYRLKLDFLEEGTTYTAYIYRDGSCRSDLKFEKKEVTKGKTLSIKEISEGGFLMQISPNDNLDIPKDRTTYEAEASANTLSGSAKRKDYDALHASGGKFVGDVGNGAKIQFNRIKASHDGEYILTIYYITHDTRPAKLLVNGEQVGDSIFFQGNGDCTSTWNPEGMGWKMFPITLNEGSKNTITIQAFDDLWAPNFDRITIHPVLSDDEITGINYNVLNKHHHFKDLEDTNYYALDGRKLSSAPAKGIFIHDGKKILR
jgi:alpha-glucosidase